MSNWHDICGKIFAELGLSDHGTGWHSAPVQWEIDYMNGKWFAMLAVNLVIGMNIRAAETESVADARAEVEVALSTSTEKRVRPEKPERPERPKNKDIAGDEVKELAAEFRAKMAELHAEQKELVKKLKSASETERTRIREQMKVNREEFNTVKEGFHDARKEVTDSLKEHAVKISAEVKGDSRGGRERK